MGNTAGYFPVEPTVSCDSAPGSEYVGAYGLSLRGIISQHSLLQSRPEWPVWHLKWHQDPSTDPATQEESWSDDRAVVAVQPAGRAVLERATSLTTWLTPVLPSPEAMVHPLLASTAVVVAQWLGRASFHAGAIAVEGRVWGILGERGMGKTSTLLGAHRAGITVITDDVLVVDGEIAYSGPRCLDLRGDAAKRFDCGRPLGIVGTRDRWRLDLPPAPPTLPFAGWVVLQWEQSVHVEPLGAGPRLTALAANRGLRVPGIDIPGLLDLVARPAVVFSRPRNWAQLDGALAMLLEVLSQT